MAAETSNTGGRTGARKRSEADPKLVEAQELLARLALEDNNNPKATEEAKKALAIDSNSVRRQSDPRDHRLAGRQEGDSLGSAHGPGI